jgi:hypothetical protein
MSQTLHGYTPTASSFHSSRKWIGRKTDKDHFTGSGVKVTLLSAICSTFCKVVLLYHEDIKNELASFESTL